ncbi:MAG: hypothetical protein HQM14_02445 [SAR324 cluster bacterium]|nr:hypothetical protein [SAR324 cluster bacterium]
MPRGGFRKGAGRKREYQEPVQKILLGLPQSVLEKLDAYAKSHQLSRPKAIALLLENQEIAEGPVVVPESIPKNKLLEELKALKNSLH